MLIEAIVIGSTFYAGNKVYQKFDRQQVSSQFKSQVKGWFTRSNTKRITVKTEERPPSPAVQAANQTLVVSSLSLGLAGAGIVLASPAISLASIPLMLYVFAPTFQEAWHDVRQKGKITNPVLDSTRLAACILMRYDLIAALNACLQAFSQKHFVQAEAEFQQQLNELYGAPQPMLWRVVQGTEIETIPNELAAGDIIALNIGDTLPTDGLILYGSAWLDQRLATGDSQPIQKQRGDLVRANSSIQSGRIYVQLENTPQSVTPIALPTQLRTILQETVGNKSWLQQMGEKNGARMAPLMLISFGLTLPLLGVNHAAAFLTTSFGSHLRTLGPYTVRNFLIPAARQGILIKDPSALEKANLINTLLFDAGLLLDPAVRQQAKEVLYQLRQRPWLMTQTSPHLFAIYLIGTGEGEESEEVLRTLTAEVGFDDYFVESLMIGRVDLIQRLQASGRTICYLGTGIGDETVMKEAFVAIAWRTAALESAAIAAIAEGAAHIVLLDKEMPILYSLFDLAAIFAAKQGFNLVAPIGLDIIDIATTLLLHFNLIYSVMFTYAGLLLGAAYGRMPQYQQKQRTVTPEDLTVHGLLTG